MATTSDKQTQRAQPHHYTAEQEQFLRDHIDGTSYKEMQRLFNEHFDLSLTLPQITRGLRNFGLKNNYVAHARAKEYVLYKGDELIGTGTKKELAELIGVSMVTMDGYAAVNTRTKLAEKTKKQPSQLMIAYLIEDDEEEDEG